MRVYLFQDGLNPFFIRSSSRAGSATHRRVKMRVLIPFSSGQVLERGERKNCRAVGVVLIPFSSGQVLEERCLREADAA